MSRIVKLEIEAVKRIRAAHIEPDGSIVIIGGRNAQGKSSVLDAIAYALGGRSLIPSEPLRRGEDKGYAEVTLDDGVTIRRTFTPGGGGTLKITTADGMSPSGAQTWLDRRIGSLSFDPAAFLRQRPAEQAATLRALCGVDTSEIDAKRASVYEERKQIGRDGKTATGALESMPEDPDAPDAEVSISSLLAERRAAEDTVMRHGSLLAEAERRRDEATTIRSQAESAATAAEREAAELESRAAAKRAEAKAAATAEAKAAATAAKKAAAAEKQAAAMVLPDLSAFDGQISSAEQDNARARARAERDRKASEVKTLREMYAQHTDEIARLDAERAAALASATMPLDGLGIDTNGAVTYRDIPLEQASQAEQLRVSLAIGMALSPDLKIMLIRDGSLLDAENLALLAEEAEERGAQVWVERVGNADERAIVIEDGAVFGVTKATE